jgi:drug/metabolite transporter (DMT)-like permease
MTKVILSFLFIISCTVSANLLLKIGATSAGADRVTFLFVPWQTIAGLFLFGLSGLLYAWVLQFVPLYVAQSFTSAQFVAVIFGSYFYLAEPIPAVRWFGIVLIFAGIMLVAGFMDK